MPPRQLGHGDAARRLRPEPPRLPARGRAAGQERQARVAGTATTGERRSRSAPAFDTRSGMHPVEDDPDLRARIRAAGQADRVEREIAELESRVQRHNQSLAREFDGVLGVLSTFGYVDRDGVGPHRGGEDAGPDVPRDRICSSPSVCGSGCSTASTPAELAGLVSTFVYEHRSPDDPPPPWFPSDDVKRRWRSIAAVSEDLARDRAQHGLAEHRPPEPTFIAVAYAWIAGESFAEVVADEELTGGDFVRTMKQLIDLLGRSRSSRLIPTTRARRAAGRRRRVPRRRRRFGVAVGGGLTMRSDPTITGDDSEGRRMGRAGRPAGRTRRRRLRRRAGGARRQRLGRRRLAVAAGDLHRTLGDGAATGRRCNASRSTRSASSADGVEQLRRRPRRRPPIVVARTDRRRVQLRVPRALGCRTTWSSQRRSRRRDRGRRDDDAARSGCRPGGVCRRAPTSRTRRSTSSQRGAGDLGVRARR